MKQLMQQEFRALMAIANPAPARIARIAPAQIAWLTPAQIARLTPDQIARRAVVLGLPFVVLLAIELLRAGLDREDKSPAIRLSLDPADVMAMAVEQKIGATCEYCANGVHEMPGQCCDCACHGRR